MFRFRATDPGAGHPAAHADPAPSVDLSAKYANAMIAAFAAEPLVLHVVQTVKSTASLDAQSKKIDATMTLDLSDRDLSMHLETTAEKKTTKVDMVVVGRAVYARVGKDHWSQGVRSNFEQSIADIARALQPVRNPASLRYVGVETIDKRKLVHLTAAKTFQYISRRWPERHLRLVRHLGRGGRHAGPGQGQDLAGRCLRHGDQGHERTPLLQVRRADRDRRTEGLTSRPR